MQVCTSLQTDNHANTSLLSFLQAGCPSCRPTNSVKALKAAVMHTVKKHLPSAIYRCGSLADTQLHLCQNSNLKHWIA